MTKKETLLFGDEEESAPDDLPEIEQVIKSKGPVDTARVCEKCQSTNIRINNTSVERRAFCGGCGHSWAISMATATMLPDGLFERGLHKRTLVEPDWDLAFEDQRDTPEDDE